MESSRDFLTSGPSNVLKNPDNPLLGIKFVSISGAAIEFIGEIVEIINSVAIIKDPILMGRDTANRNKFNYIIFHKANPIVNDVIEVPLPAIAFMCHPNEEFVKNYKAARSGLVTAANVYGSDG